MLFFNKCAASANSLPYYVPYTDRKLKARTTKWSQSHRVSKMTSRVVVFHDRQAPTYLHLLRHLTKSD